MLAYLCDIYCLIMLSPTTAMRYYSKSNIFLNWRYIPIVIRCSTFGYLSWFNCKNRRRTLTLLIFLDWNILHTSENFRTSDEEHWIPPIQFYDLIFKSAITFWNFVHNIVLIICINSRKIAVVAPLLLVSATRNERRL